jgi:hypothetical protein
MKLNAKAFGLSLGTILGVYIFIKIIAIQTTGNVERFIEISGNFLRHILTVQGAVIGLVLGIVVGFIVGAIISILYNKLSS